MLNIIKWTAVGLLTIYGLKRLNQEWELYSGEIQRQRSLHKEVEEVLWDS